MLITTDSGDELNGRIRELTAEALIIITRREQATVPFAEIVRIASREPLDRQGTGWQLVLTVLPRLRERAGPEQFQQRSMYDR